MKARYNYKDNWPSKSKEWEAMHFKLGVKRDIQ